MYFFIAQWLPISLCATHYVLSGLVWDFVTWGSVGPFNVKDKNVANSAVSRDTLRYIIFGVSTSYISSV